MGDDREGMVGPDGKWWGPELIKASCVARMEQFDKLRREARDLINANGSLKPHEVKTSKIAYAKYIEAYRWRP